MVPSLRDLMHNERDKRKRTDPTVKLASAAAKIQKLSQEAETPTTSTLDDAQESVKVVEETFELIEEDEDQFSGSSNYIPKQTTNKAVKKTNEATANIEAGAGKVYDDQKLVYDQLNTAFCGNIDFERENIVKEFSIVDESLAYDECDSMDEQMESASKISANSTITSSNFGCPKVTFSKDENLPVGFFDDKNFDATARGKLTAKEAQEKLAILSKKKSSYLKEAKYVNEKFVESHREKIRLENDQIDHDETMKELQSKVIAIKKHITAEGHETSQKTQYRPSTDTFSEEIDHPIDDDDYGFSWRSRSLVLNP